MAEIGKQEIEDKAIYEKRVTDVRVKKEFNEWREKISGIPTLEAINNAKDIYEGFKERAIQTKNVDVGQAMQKAKSLAEAMETYYELLENKIIKTKEAYDKEMRLRQTHNDFTSPIYLVGQGSK